MVSGKDLVASAVTHDAMPCIKSHVLFRRIVGQFKRKGKRVGLLLGRLSSK